MAVHRLFEHERLPTRVDVLLHQRMRRVHGHVAQSLRVRVVRHLQAQRIVRVQHRRIRRDLDRHALDLRELLDRVDAAQAEMIGGHVQAGGNVAALEAQAAAQHAAARRFHDGRIDRGVSQDHLGRLRAGHVARHAELAVDVDAVGRGQPDRESRQLQDVREHARGRRLAVRAGHRGDRHARRRAGRKQHVDDGAADVSRRAFAGRNVHAKAGPGIHFANRTARFPIRKRDVPGQEIDATDVEADGVDGADRHLPVVRVNGVRHVDRRAAGREVRRGAQVDDLVFRRHRGPVVADLLQKSFRLVIELQARQHFFVADAATRILVDDIHQLFDGVLAVADDVAGFALGGGDELAVDDEQAVVVAFDVALDDHRAPVLPGLLERDFDFFGGLEIDRHAAAVVPRQRLEHHREPDSLRRADRVPLPAH